MDIKLFYSGIFLSFLILSLSSCAGTSDKTTEAASDDQTIVDTSVPRSNIITANSAGLFHFGTRFSELPEGFEIIKRRESGGEGSWITAYEVKKDGILELKLYPGFDENFEETDWLGEILIFDAKYKTEEGIGVGSTLQELITAYPEYKLWYTYVSDRFIAENGMADNMQFLLSPDAFKGDKEKLYIYESVVLEADQFDLSGKITSVRVFMRMENEE